MSIKDIIEQLQDLKYHCASMSKWIEEEESNVWLKDVEALDFAVATLENEEKLIKENRALKNRCKVST